jgi:hypothetical protein
MTRARPTRAAEFEEEEYRRVPTAENESVIQSSISPKLLKKLFWILTGAFLVFITDIHSHMLNWRTRLHHASFYFLIASIAVSMLSLAYIVIFVKRVHGPKAMARWKTFAPNAVPILTGSQVLSFVAAARLFYPIYGRWTLPLVTVLSVAWLNLLTFV